MKKQTFNLINNFSICEKDKIRIREKYHEKRLKTQLVEFGIIVEFESIAHHGIRNIKN